MSVTGKAVGEVVRERLDSLSPAERKLARGLLASYPIARLPSGGRVPRAGGVRHAAPVRCRSPLPRLRAQSPARGTDSVLNEALDVASHNLKATLDVLSH